MGDLKHSQITRELLAELAAGKYAATGRLPSEAQLVQRFGVSRPTVARALRDLQAQGLIDRRAGSGSFARSPVSSAIAARQLGLLIPGLGSTAIFEAICGELASLARAQGYGLLWGSGSSRPKEDLGIEDAAELCEQFIRNQVAGVFFAPFEQIHRSEELNTELVKRLRRVGIAVILLDRDLGAFPQRSECDLIGVDNFAGGYRLADHLIRLGCRSLAYAVLPKSAAPAAARIAGARAAAYDHGLPVPADFVHSGDPADPDFAAGFCGRNKVDAILAANDAVAALLLRTLDRAGIRSPADVRIVGFDDIAIASLLSVPLTTIRQPSRELAVVALRTMLDRIADPSLPARSITLTASLVVRESCGAYLEARTVRAFQADSSRWTPSVTCQDGS